MFPLNFLKNNSVLPLPEGPTMAKKTLSCVDIILFIVLVLVKHNGFGYATKHDNMDI